MNKQQLAAKIWASANEMRSKIEASEYKDYILGFIFYKFLSEKEESWLHGQGFEDADMASVTEADPDIVGFVRPNLGYFIAYEHLYGLKGRVCTVFRKLFLKRLRKVRTFV